MCISSSWLCSTVIITIRRPFLRMDTVDYLERRVYITCKPRDRSLEAARRTRVVFPTVHTARADEELLYTDDTAHMCREKTKNWQWCMLRLHCMHAYASSMWHMASCERRVERTCSAVVVVLLSEWECGGHSGSARSTTERGSTYAHAHGRRPARKPKGSENLRRRTHSAVQCRPTR
jgi:hypothetical protein